MIQILVNQAVNGHPVSPDVIGKQIGKPVFHAIPRDDASCIAALSRSTPVLIGAKGSPFGSGVTDCVRKLIQKNVLKTLEKLTKPQDTGSPTNGPKGDGVPDDNKKKDQWTDLKSRIHKALVEEMDLKKQDDSDPKAKIILREQTKKMVVELLGKEDTKNVLPTRDDMNRIVKEILDEALGLGPLEDMLADKSITEIMVVGPKKIYYEQSGKVKKSEITFTNDRQVMNVIERIVAPIGRRIDEKTPYVDARLADGSRVHAIITPCAID
jgi:septum site-determining protein MinD